MGHFILEKPAEPQNPADVLDVLFSSTSAKKSEIFEFLKGVSGEKYPYWDTFKYKEPAPANIPKQNLWYIAKFSRHTNSTKTVIRDIHNNYFSWNKLKYFEQSLHTLDLETGGELFVTSADVRKVQKQKMITRGILEEAIASSQLEGAATSRRAAKKMIQEGRKPKNESEQMILNNYTSLKAVEEEYKHSRMTMPLMLELHGMITKDTRDSNGDVPHLRQPSEPVVVSDKVSGEIYHEGPPADFIKQELPRLIDFANDDLGTGEFVHPVIRAIMLHFWIGYLHPFSDGNGRFARLIFYWYLLKRGYWAFSYLPISKIIKKSPQQYIMAYVYSEQDDNDMTYFIDYNLRKIDQARAEFTAYVERQSKENARMKTHSEIKYGFNVRQIQLLQYLYGDEETRTNIAAHMHVNQISRMTASNDLQDLANKGFLTKQKYGKGIFYYPTEEIKKLF